ncbi:M14 family zinc carboxypeptidase [Thalassotalea atypica]|uniref:M14 family zinc carboxypeptidase n=1 Tax=Thalassotalea atypica TaxID=2054316 RepID=UPI0025747A4D|nr:M14 family zinc carboxypeptidase [Thalassotalea atypica]
MFFRQNIFLVAFVLISSAFFSSVTTSAPLSYYLPENHSYTAELLKPSAFIGSEIGEQHLRHDQLVGYLSHLASQSNRIKLTEMGKTYQQRTQLLLTISSPENLANLDTILADRDKKSYRAGNDPVVVWLGYSVHGDEISGAHAALIVAYHLAASQDKSIEQMLKETIIVIEPSINPDGMDRFANWANTFKGMTANPDPNHIEHHQHWPSGRTNHFWFDLNRDWLLLSQQESQNRLKYFHQYQPNVLGDFHEMGANGTYFFQPGIPSRTHPLTPKENTKLTQDLAKFHAKALDANERLYYSEESFDDFYYGKGSTYPDVNGSVGILFEQASSRGQQQDTVNGLLTFEYGIKNHVLTSLSTIKGTWVERNVLRKYRQSFYQDVEELAKKEKIRGYIVYESKDLYRLNAFLDKLDQHQIDVFPLASDFRLNSKLYAQQNSFFIPLNQPQFRLIQAIFSTQKNFEDNTFYDVSGWTIPLAMNIEFAAVNRAWGLKLAEQAWQPKAKQKQEFTGGAYAYAIEWQHFLAPKLLNELISQGVKVKVANKAFSSIVKGNKKDFKPGTLVVLAGTQNTDEWRVLLEQASNKNQIPSYALTTGLTINGIDLGSSSFRPIEPRKVLMLGGNSVSQYEAGEVRYYLDNQLSIPVSIVEPQRFMQIDLADYTHIVLVNGQYGSMPEKVTDKLSHWVKNGGTVIAQKKAVGYLVKHNILNAKVASKQQLDTLFDTDGLRYQDKEKLAGRKRIAGAIFATELDLSHPLAYGYDRSILPMFRNSTIIIDSPAEPFVAVAKYLPDPLLSGYTDQNLVNRIAHNAAIVAHNLGKGRVIATSENLAFRGYWYGSAKILANAIFFDKAFSVTTKE